MKTLEKPNHQSNQTQASLLQDILECYIDGILILTEHGKWVRANHYARRVCAQLRQNQRPNQFNQVPQPIWRVCEALIESQSIEADQPVIIESEITNAQFPALSSPD